MEITAVRTRQDERSHTSCLYKNKMTTAEAPLLDELRMVLVGRCGEGKTSSGRTILGKTNSGYCATKTCWREEENIDGQKVVLVDTPGLFKPKTSNEKVVKQIKKSISEAGPGPHVFLLVMKLNKVFTQEVQETVEIICQTFGKNMMAYTLVLFTNGDALQGTDIEDYIASNTNLRNLIIQCHWKYHVFENTVQRPQQVRDLLEKIRNMIQTNRGSCYTEEMLKEAEDALKQQQQAQNLNTIKPMQWIRFASSVVTAAGALVGYFAVGGEMTSSIGAAIGALAGGILGVIAACLLIKNCRRKRRLWCSV